MLRSLLIGMRLAAPSVEATGPGTNRVVERLAAGRPLDLHEGIATNGGCDRWPKALRLASTGRLVPGRCRATNLCAYCAALYVIETVECLTLDALGGNAPNVWAVLTAREHLTRKELNVHLAMVRRQMRREGWRWEEFRQVEFQKRGALHVNLLVKALTGGDSEAWFARLRELWCSRVDAEPVGQWCESIDDALAVSRYVAKLLAHGLKSSQAPPVGWKGHRTSHTRGYFARPMWQERRDARRSLQLKRELWKADQLGHDPIEAQAVAEAALEASEAREWELVVVSVDENGELHRVRPAAGGGVRSAMRSDRPAATRREHEDNYQRALDALAEGVS